MRKPAPAGKKLAAPVTNKRVIPSVKDSAPVSREEVKPPVQEQVVAPTRPEIHVGQRDS